MAVVRQSASAAIVAGPGAGKTELLAQRASFLLQTGACPSPRRILAISFKRDAAKNVRQRVSSRVGADLAKRFESYTFEAFAKSLLDRFREGLPKWCRPSRDYSIVFPRFGDWREFTDKLALNVTGQQLEAAHANFGAEPNSLSLDRPRSATPVEEAALRWWEASVSSTPSRLTFGMISTLATTILRHNPLIKTVLQQTYSHVFLDEFQDTTGLQYRLLQEAFQDSQVVVTAVGDTKQRIMTWAGALPESFAWLERDFGAEPFALAVNFRSNRRIVSVVNSMAQSLEERAVQVVCARADAPVPEPADGILEFVSRQQEAESLAEIIADEVQRGERRPDDFLLLVRQLADGVEADLRPSFSARGLAVRNEARSVGGVAIQELMTEPLADLVIALIQMAIDDRTDDPFHRVRIVLEGPLGTDDERPEVELRIDRAMRSAVAIVRAATERTAPAGANFAQLVKEIIGAIGEVAVRQTSPDYENLERLATVEGAVTEFLKETASEVGDWRALVDQFLGRAQVRLMTVHKSKGLEADTVIFLRLQDSSFNARADMEEERYAFFVAASRARERLFVTVTPGSRERVAPLWAMLESAGVSV